MRPRGSGATERPRRLPTRSEPRGRAGRRAEGEPTRPPPKEGPRWWESEERGDRGSGRSELSERGAREGERASGREEAPADERKRERERRDARDRTRATSAKRERQRRGNHERGERGRRAEGERSACGESSEREETKRRERNANEATARRGRPRGDRDLTRTAEGTREGRKAEPRTAEPVTAPAVSQGASGASAAAGALGLSEGGRLMRSRTLRLLGRRAMERGLFPSAERSGARRVDCIGVSFSTLPQRNCSGYCIFPLAPYRNYPSNTLLGVDWWNRRAPLGGTLEHSQDAC